MLGFEVSPVTESSSMYPFRVPSASIGRVMLSTQRLWPSSCSFCVAFMVSSLAPDFWLPEVLYPPLHAADLGDPIAQGSIRVTEPSPSFATQIAVVPTAIAPGSGPTAIGPPSGSPEGRPR